jgi:predicted ester cyclase
LSYDVHGTRSRTGLKRYYSDLRRSFPDLRFEVHENIGVLVEGDLVALRTIITGTHAGDYAGLAPTGRPIQTSASHIFRVRDDQFVEHWQVLDTYRVLVAIGAIPRAANAFQQILGVEESPGGLFQERNRVRQACRTTCRTRGVPGRRAPPSPSIEEGLIAEHWETVDWIRVYQSFGLLSDEVKDV